MYVKSHIGKGGIKGIEGGGKRQRSKVDKNRVSMLLTIISYCIHNRQEYKTKQWLSRKRVQLLKRCQIIVPQLDTSVLYTRGCEKKKPNPTDFGTFVLHRWHG